MTKGTKLALGCLGAGCLVVAGGAAVLVFGVGASAYWLKDKAQGFVGHEQKIEALKVQANRVPLTRPPTDGDRGSPLEVPRRAPRVFSVYEKHRPEFEAMKNKRDADLSDIQAAFGVLGEARLAVAQAMADVGMSEGEYQFMVQAVYQSAWAAEIEKSSGKKPSEAMSEAMRQAQDAMKKGVDAARQQGVPVMKDIPDDAVQTADDEMSKAAESMKSLDAPAANIELFRKHEAEIKKYAMHGLEFLGL
jgi:hypothetical protein